MDEFAHFRGVSVEGGLGSEKSEVEIAVVFDTAQEGDLHVVDGVSEELECGEGFGFAEEFVVGGGFVAGEQKAEIFERDFYRFDVADISVGVFLEKLIAMYFDQWAFGDFELGAVWFLQNVGKARESECGVLAGCVMSCVEPVVGGEGGEFLEAGDFEADLALGALGVLLHACDVAAGGVALREVGVGVDEVGVFAFGLLRGSGQTEDLERPVGVGQAMDRGVGGWLIMGCDCLCA